MASTLLPSDRQSSFSARTQTTYNKSSSPFSKKTNLAFPPSLAKYKAILAERDRAMAQKYILIVNQIPKDVKNNQQFENSSISHQKNLLSQLPRLPIKSSSELGWKNIQITHYRQPAAEIPEHSLDFHGIYLNTGKTVRLKQKIAGQTITSNSFREDLGIYPAHISQSFAWNSEADFLLIYLSADLITKLGYELYQSNSVELIPQIETCFDPLILQIAIALNNALENQVDNNIYADSMANALSVHLLSQYSNCSRDLKSSKSKLSQPQLEQVTDYIYGNLDQNLSLKQLAAVVQLSEYHFAHLFKQTTGKAPHQFQLQCRIDRAKELLLQDMAIAKVAQTIGFSSQSHLNYHFKRRVGATPKQFLTGSKNL